MPTTTEWIAAAPIVVPLLAGVIAWFANERRKRTWEEYVRKEQHYIALVRSLRGFYSASASKELRDEFIQQVNLCWLYCPDDVIRKAYAFLDSVHERSGARQEESELALGAFVAAIRKDMLKRRVVARTGLESSDFRRIASR